MLKAKKRDIIGNNSCITTQLCRITCRNTCPWVSYQIRKIAGCACTGNAGNVFPAIDFKGNRKLAIPACITERASRTCRDACRDRLSPVAGKTFPAHAHPTILRIWQEAHCQIISEPVLFLCTVYAERFMGWSIGLIATLHCFHKQFYQHILIDILLTYAFRNAQSFANDLI